MGATVTCVQCKKAVSKRSTTHIPKVGRACKSHKEMFENMCQEVIDGDDASAITKVVKSIYGLLSKAEVSMDDIRENFKQAIEATVKGNVFFTKKTAFAVMDHEMEIVNNAITHWSDNELDYSYMIDDSKEFTYLGDV